METAVSPQLTCSFKGRFHCSASCLNRLACAPGFFSFKLVGIQRSKGAEPKPVVGVVTHLAKVLAPLLCYHRMLMGRKECFRTDVVAEFWGRVLGQSFGPEWRSWADVLSAGLADCLEQVGQRDVETESLFFFPCQLKLATVHGCTCCKHHPPDHLYMCPSAQTLMRTNSMWTNRLGTSQAWSPSRSRFSSLPSSLSFFARRKPTGRLTCSVCFFFFTMFHWEQITAEVCRPARHPLTDRSHFLLLKCQIFNPLFAENSGLAWICPVFIKLFY